MNVQNIFWYILLYFGQWSSKKFQPGPVGEPGGSHPSRRPHSAIPGPCASPSATAVLHGSVNGWRCMLRPSVPGWMHRGRPPGHASRAWWCKAGAGLMNLWYLDNFGDIWWNRRVYAGGIGGIQDFSSRQGNLIVLAYLKCTATAFAQANFQWGIVGLKVWQGIQISDPQRQLWVVIPVSCNFSLLLGGFPPRVMNGFLTIGCHRLNK